MRNNHLDFIEPFLFKELLMYTVYNHKDSERVNI